MWVEISPQKKPQKVNKEFRPPGTTCWRRSRSGNGRFNDGGYRGGARPAVQNFCAASSDIARSLCLYRYRARSGYNDLVDHAHEYYRRDVLASGVFGRRPAQIPDLYRTI